MADSIDWSALAPVLLAALAFGYLVGSIPFGPVIARLAGLGDLRKIGSGNIGATNMLRTGRKSLAAGTLAGDMLKGTVAVLVASRWGPEAATAAGLGAFLGHLYPVWLGFRGGKGVATYIGILIGLNWLVALIFAAIWLGTAWLTKLSSLSALIAAAAAPVVLVLFGQWLFAGLALALSALVFFRHNENIGRILRGEEPRIGATR